MWNAVIPYVSPYIDKIGSQVIGVQDILLKLLTKFAVH